MAEPTVTIIHFGRHHGAVFGHLTVDVDGKTVLEGVCLENERTLIPPGEYVMRRDRTGKHRWWVILGGDLGLAGSGAPREQVEAHAGSHGIHSLGCVIPGLTMRPFPEPGTGAIKMGVTDSVAMLRKMLLHLGDEDVRLVVEEPIDFR